MLLYFMKHSRPDIANATGQLSKIMVGANQASFPEMHQVINYVLNTRSLGLKLEQKKTRRNPGSLFVSVIVTMQEIQSQEEAQVALYCMFWICLYLGNQKHREA